MTDWLKYSLYVLFGTTGAGGIVGFIIWVIKFYLKNKYKKKDENKSNIINNTEIKEINNYYVTIYELEKDVLKFEHGNDINGKWIKLRFPDKGDTNNEE